MKPPLSRDLKPFNAFGIEQHAREIHPLDQIEALPSCRFCPDTDILLGGGSNVLLLDPVPGTAWINRLPGRRIESETREHAVVWAGGGENWHHLVRWTLRQGLSGLENLSLIPGSVGAAPIQNIGAYGVELADRLVSLDAWDWRQQAHRTFDAIDCGFAYRDSRFKSDEPGRWLVTGIRMRLDRQFSPKLEYQGLTAQLERDGFDHPNAEQVSDAVIAVRRAKLPDPERIGNAGSFFKNPVVPIALAETLRSRIPGLTVHQTAQGSKLSAAQLIEAAGWKGTRRGDAGVSEQHALVLVNHGTAKGHELLALAIGIARDIQAQFGVTLEPEPRLLPGDTDTLWSRALRATDDMETP